MNFKKLHLKRLSTAFLARFVAAVFILVSVFGIFICTSLFMKMSMPMDTTRHDSASFNCAFGMDMGQASLCPMSVIEHISNWQQFFTAVAPTDLLGLLAVMLVAGVGLFIGMFAPHSASPPLTVVRLWLYYKQHWGIKLHNYFLHIFARGIVQPKLFA